MCAHIMLSSQVWMANGLKITQPSNPCYDNRYSHQILKLPWLLVKTPLYSFNSDLEQENNNVLASLANIDSETVSSYDGKCRHCTWQKLPHCY